MGVLSTKNRQYIPIIGEIKLRFGLPTNHEALILINEDFQSTNDIKLIIAKLVNLQKHHYLKSMRFVEPEQGDDMENEPNEREANE